MNETWKPVIDAVGYEVSNIGRVRSWRRKGSRVTSALATTPKLLKTSPNAYGYPSVNIARNGDRQKPVAVHILLLSAFVGPCPDGCEALHDDGNRMNCVLSNLAWGTRTDNIADKIRHGNSIRPTIRGEKHFRGRLSNKQVVHIKRLLEHEYNMAHIAKIYDVHPNTIESIKSGRSWKWLTLKSHSK
jgi:hypothetical protein